MSEPWWRPNRRDAVVLLILAAVAGWLFWPREPPSPVQLLRQGTVGTTGWSILGQRAGTGAACLQVRAGGARQALMCDQHWDRDVHRLWHGPPPPGAGPVIAAPSLLRVGFPGSDEVLVVSVLYGEITTLRAPSGSGVAVPTAPLFDTTFRYVAAVLPAADAAGLQAFAADGEPLYYHYVEAPPG